jgi:cyclopropane fatty-acyl-phospholipid synthase-like methyltransferase
VLRACRRLLRPGGSLAFFTIFVAAGLSAADRRRAVAVGPPAPDNADLQDSLRRSGLVDVEAYDVSAAYAETARAWLAARLRHRDVLRPLNPAVFDGRINEARVAIPAIEAGLLRRSLFVARRG